MLCVRGPKTYPLVWRHNEREGVSHHQPHQRLLNRLFGRRSKKTSKLGVTGLCAGNSPVTGEFPPQRASNAEIFPFDDVIMNSHLIQSTNIEQPDDIYPHWKATTHICALFNPSNAEIGIFRGNWVNVITIEGLDPCVTRSSTTWQVKATPFSGPNIYISQGIIWCRDYLCSWGRS